MSKRLTFEEKIRELNENKEETKWILSGSIIKEKLTFSDGVEKRSWINQQKHKMKTKQLSDVRINILQDMLKNNTLSFKDKIEELYQMTLIDKQKKTAYHHNSKDKKLFSDKTDASIWLTKQKYYLNQGKLTSEEQELLENLLEELSLNFEDKINELKISITEDKHLPVMYKKDRKNLGYRTFSNGTDQRTWLLRQKKKLEEGKLNTKEIMLLTDILQLIEKEKSDSDFKNSSSKNSLIKKK